MKQSHLLGFLFFAAFHLSQAGLVTYNWTSDFANAGLVPDQDINGWQDTRTISGFQSGSQILDVNVTLNISGGFNGDLFGSLVHDSGFVVLLNHVGASGVNPAGSAYPGMDVTLDQSAGVNIHNALVFTGTYQPDSTYSPATSLTSFNGLDPNGAWTFYLQDTSFGDQSQVLGWGLQIDAVPEPTTLALGVFGVLAVSTALGRKIYQKVKTTKP